MKDILLCLLSSFIALSLAACGQADPPASTAVTPTAGKPAKPADHTHKPQAESHIPRTTEK